MMRPFWAKLRLAPLIFAPVNSSTMSDSSMLSRTRAALSAVITAMLLILRCAMA